MSYSDYELQTDLRGAQYRLLLDWLAERHPSGLLVLRPGLGLEMRGQLVLERLAPFVESRSLSKEWPGTRLLDEEAEIVRFRLCDESIQVLKESADRVLEWQQPVLPEDLCVLRESGDPVLSTTAHEGYATLHLSTQEMVQLREVMPELAQLLRRHETP